MIDSHKDKPCGAAYEHDHSGKQIQEKINPGKAEQFHGGYAVGDPPCIFDLSGNIFCLSCGEEEEDIPNMP